MTGLWTASILVVCLTASGCGDGLASLQGMVTIDGQPAPRGLVLEFSPLGVGSSSYATTDAEGRYEAAFTFRRKGIEPGEHLVRLLPSQVEPPMPEIDASGRPVAPEKTEPAAVKLPQKYYGEVETIVVAAGRNTHDFELVSEPE